MMSLPAQREIGPGYINLKNMVKLNLVNSTTKHSLGDKQSRNSNLKTGCSNKVQYNFLFLVTAITRCSKNVFDHNLMFFFFFGEEEKRQNLL